MQDYWNETVGKRGLLVQSELRDDWEAVAARVEESLLEVNGPTSFAEPSPPLFFPLNKL